MIEDRRVAVWGVLEMERRPARGGVGGLQGIEDGRVVVWDGAWRRGGSAGRGGGPQDGSVVASALEAKRRRTARSAT